MQTLDLKPSHAAVKKYYDALNQYGQLSISHEQAVKTAFHDLLSTCGRRFDWILVPEYKFKGPKGTTLSADAGMVTTFKQLRGLWEAKDGDDNLEKEIKKKFDVGYPKKNIIFQEPQKAILYQGGVRQGLNEDITDPKNLVELVKHFFAYREPHHEEWEHAVAEFKEQVPNLAGALKEIIEKERKGNKRFIESFEAFVILCRQAINPNLSDEAVETMLIQHLLTERIFRTVFGNPDFSRRNVIAIEIEKVIDALTSKSFNRDKFLQQLDVFYRAIEDSAKDATDYTEKQTFLNTVYERFFQGFSKKEADTHGIVYTPQPIVDFMVRSVEDILQKEFGKSLSDEGVHILDPFVGTGNFITRVMKEIKSTKLRQKYENELHCNEIMLLPYYIASMNIEHEYLERMGEYRPFPGICLVDTFELAEAQQSSLFTAENTERVERQKRSPITVIIGNPPYNVGQVNENDNNKNRRYPVLDRRVSETYAMSSKASLLSKLGDPYIKAFRWASDRLESDGIVAFVSNSSFIDQFAFDGVRNELCKDFNAIYILDLDGNVRQNPKLSGTTHNVFGIQVGVSINLFVRRAKRNKICELNYAHVEEQLRRERKLDVLDGAGDYSHVTWQKIEPKKGTWLHSEMRDDFDSFIPIADKVSKKTATEISIFKSFSLGVGTNRDQWVYAFSETRLIEQVQKLIKNINNEASRFGREIPSSEDFEKWLNTDPTFAKWTDRVKNAVKGHVHLKFSEEAIRTSLYRPFTVERLYFDSLLNQRQYQQQYFFPKRDSQNVVLCCPSAGGRAPYWAFAAGVIANLTLTSIDGNQCFPFYTYDKDGANRRENITDWALEQFRAHYKDKKITKWDIFNYTYGVLHDREYRTRYAANLKRELPRIPFASATSVSHPVAQEQEPNDKGGARAPDVASPDGSHPIVQKKDDRMGHPIAQSGASNSSGESHPSLDRRLAQSAAPDTGSGAGSRHGDATELQRDRDPSAKIRPQDDKNKLAGNSHERGAPESGSGTPDAEVFWAYAKAGKRLAEIHVEYEKQKQFKLEERETGGKFDWRVEKMRLSKDKTSLTYNEGLTLSGIPAEVYEYRLGNRSALEWVVDQYQVSTDKRSGIVNDPNREDDPEYIYRLIGQVISVSLETVAIVKSLPGLGLPEVVEKAASNIQ